MRSGAPMAEQAATNGHVETPAPGGMDVDAVYDCGLDAVACSVVDGNVRATAVGDLSRVEFSGLIPLEVGLAAKVEPAAVGDPSQVELPGVIPREIGLAVAVESSPIVDSSVSDSQGSRSQLRNPQARRDALRSDNGCSQVLDVQSSGHRRPKGPTSSGGVALQALGPVGSSSGRPPASEDIGLENVHQHDATRQFLNSKPQSSRTAMLIHDELPRTKCGDLRVDVVPNDEVDFEELISFLGAVSKEEARALNREVYQIVQDLG